MLNLSVPRFLVVVKIMWNEWKELDVEAGVKWKLIWIALPSWLQRALRRVHSFISFLFFHSPWLPTVRLFSTLHHPEKPSRTSEMYPEICLVCYLAKEAMTIWGWYGDTDYQYYHFLLLDSTPSAEVDVEGFSITMSSVLGIEQFLGAELSRRVKTMQSAEIGKVSTDQDMCHFSSFSFRCVFLICWLWDVHLITYTYTFLIA